MTQMANLKQQPRELEQRARGGLRAAVVGGADVLDGGVHLLVYVEHGVGGLKHDFGNGLLALQVHAALDHHVYGDVVAGVYALSGHEAVQAGHVADHHSRALRVRGDEHVQHAEALVAAAALLTQPAVSLRDVYGALKVVAGVAAVAHYEGRERNNGAQRAEPPALPAVAKPASSIIGHGETSRKIKCSMLL